MIKQLLALVAAGVMQPATSSPVPELGPQLAEIRSFSASEGEKLWPGYGSAAFGFLLVTDKEENLLCRDTAPEDFEPAGTEPATGCSRFTRNRSSLPANLLAAMPVFGPPSVIVMGTPEATGRTEASWKRTILHEHFHQWQYELPDYFDRIKALDLHDGDETGMWILNYPFPYDDAAVGTVLAEASNALADAVAARGTREFFPRFDAYLARRSALEHAVGAKNWRYAELQLWQEGVARWTEIRLGKVYPDPDVAKSAATLEERTLAALRSPDLVKQRRQFVYAHGAAEAMLMETCGPQWRVRYVSVLSLGPLLNEARATCGRGA